MIKEFFNDIKEGGLRVAFDNLLLEITMKIIGAKGFHIDYKKDRLKIKKKKK